MMAQQSQQHQHQQQLANEQMMRQANEQMFGPGGGGMGDMVNGDVGGGGPTNGHGGANGNISRPGSSAGYLQPPSNGAVNGLSPLSNAPPHNSSNNGSNAGPSPRPNSPGLRLSLPPPSLGLSSVDLTPGGTTRPFAGAPQSVTPVPVTDLPIDLSASSNGIPVDVHNYTSNDPDLFADLSLDFEFSDFLVDGDT